VQLARNDAPTTDEGAMPNPEQPTKVPPPEPPAEPSAEQKPEKASEEDEFHPHRHGHVAIHPAESAVTHLDPGAVTFS
jgi:hypothetical protein